MYRELPKEDKVETKPENSGHFEKMKCFFGYHDMELEEILHIERSNAKILRVYDPRRIYCARCGKTSLKAPKYWDHWRLCRKYDNVVAKTPHGTEYKLISNHASFSDFGDGPCFGYGNTAFSEHFEDEGFLDEFLDGLREEAEQNPTFYRFLLLSGATNQHE